MTADHFDLTVSALLGQPWPPLPALPGVVHVCQDDAAPDPATERVALLLSDLSTREVGAVLGLSRQRVHQMRQRLSQAETPGLSSLCSPDADTVPENPLC